MKNWLRVCLVFIIIICLGVVKMPDTAQAISPAEGSWNTGQEVKLDMLKNPGPSWMNLLSTAIKITAPAKICHPFRGGQYHWVGQIMQLKDGKWTKVTTVNDWVPSKEGEFMSCAQANEAGTYALFGYYNGPAETANDTSTCKLDTSKWTGIVRWDGESYIMIIYLGTDVAAGLPVTYNVYSTHISYIDSLTGTSTTQFFEDSKPPNYTILDSDVTTGEWTIGLKVTIDGCSKNFTLSGVVD